MSSFLIFCCLLAISGPLTLALEHPREDVEDLSDVERMLNDVIDSVSNHEELLMYKRKFDYTKESFRWIDCGGRGSVVHLKSFSISPLPLHLPGTVTVALNATVDADVEPPIGLDLMIKKKIALSWINVCKFVPGGCHRQNICNTQPASAAAADGESSPFCEMKKGDFSLPPTPFALTDKAPSGWYRISAKFRKGNKVIGCIFVQLNIG